ncbi:hypothetical protein FOZ63_030566 [Perkinsus olseni]|uniref:Palmitoyltransferase n=1 Tax=Perkinsus olseni TaxID=32597 RepID=A0A7J6UB98_PEROL|nr:hypothetical protein FOZ63_030566 [Perkinsus olseni]KAF4754475.1 hypothetical protein FOZ62_027831 [Perkinsus olseni]
MHDTSHLLLYGSYDRRPNKPNNACGLCFVVVVLGFILVEYASFVFLLWGPLLPWTPALLTLCTFHVLVAMTLWSLYMSVTTDPGAVPLYWGFHIGEENKRRRYCKMCNVWKPERTHHCSICNRCNLNMDHHCPWINNCVGFYNRKFFMQLLFYVYATLAVYTAAGAYPLYLHISEVIMVDIRFLDSGDIIISITYGIAVFFITTLTSFVKFHVALVTENSTTIENLEKESGEAASTQHDQHVHNRSKYDMGCWRRNVEQVMGSSTLWWFMPRHNDVSRPVGDGVTWIKAAAHVSTEMTSSTKHL